MIGDVVNGLYRQTAISVGDGIRAAMEIYRNIESYRQGDK
jgi:thioredoxin reductase